MRFLFVGLGAIGQRHLRNLKVLRGDSAQVTAFRARGEPEVFDDRNQVIPGLAVTQHYGITLARDLDAALAEGPDVCFVTNPSSLHLAVARAAVEAGCHLFVEKPLSDSLEGVDRLLERARALGRVATVGYQYRHHPAFRRIRELVQSQALGPLHFVRAEVGDYLPDYHPAEDYRRSYAAQRSLGGGVVRTQCHEIDLLVALLGMPFRVFSLGGHLSSLDIDAEDLVTSLFEFRSPEGRLTTVTLHQDYLQRPKRRCLEILGEHGKIAWDLIRGSFRRWGSAGELLEDQDWSAYPRNQLFMSELDEFLGAIEGGPPPEVTLEQATLSLQIIGAIQASLVSGQPTSLAQ